MVLMKLNMGETRPMLIPLPFGCKLSTQMQPTTHAKKLEIQNISYASIIGSIMCTMLCT